MGRHLKMEGRKIVSEKLKSRSYGIFSAEIVTMISAEMVTSVVQQRWLQTLFSRNGYKRRSAEMVTCVAQQR